MRSHWRISSLVLGSVGVSMLITRSAGAPILTMASRIRSTIILLVSLARGCGATMIELRPLTALIALMTGVASGLVVGDTAPNTPIGFAIFQIFRSGSSSITPTAFSLLYSYGVPGGFRG